MSVISLPDRDETVKQAVDAAWEFLEAVETIEQLRYERKKAKVKAALEGVSDEEAFAEVQARTTFILKNDKKVKVAELETLIASRDEIGDDSPNGNFFARNLPSAAWNRPWMKAFERIVLVHRLREVVAQVGFTRFGSRCGGYRRGVRDRRAAGVAGTRDFVASRSRESRRGNLFAVQSVRDRSFAEPAEVQDRGRQLEAGFVAWRNEHQGTRRVFAGVPYLMLHSFSHLLITAVALECGYPASSIRERIYSVPSVGYGVLLYTGSGDAEGTLGGLIQVGRRIHDHIHNALTSSELCSNDPVCAQHEPQNQHERRFLHGAACHGCLLIAETSCEQQNDFLDRALVAPTVDNLGAEFFHVAEST